MTLVPVTIGWVVCSIADGALALSCWWDAVSEVIVNWLIGFGMKVVGVIGFSRARRRVKSIMKTFGMIV